MSEEHRQPVETRSEPATFEQLTPIEADRPTLVEGLPGHGLVASIAVDQIQRQLELVHHGNVVSEAFPQVVTFQDGLVQDLVRVYAGEDPPVMTLQSDVAIPANSFQALSRCVTSDIAEEFGRAIFLAGAPASSEEEIGVVEAAATTEAVKADLKAANVPIADDIGLVGDVTGALANACYHEDIPAAILVVRAHPWLPDPGAARAVIENALEPLVEFEIDTTELREQADEIQAQMKQVAEQYRQMAEQRGESGEQPAGSSMFQ